MNEDTRQLGAFTLTIAGACAAISLFVLSPLQQSNRAASEKLSSAQAAAKQLGELQPMGPLWDQQIQQATRANEWYEASGELAANPAKLHSKVTRFARARSITIDRIDPSTASTSNETVESTGLSIQATGKLDQLTAFLEELTSECGFTRIDSFIFTPMQADDDQLVRATIQTTHFAFQAPTNQVAQAEQAQ